MTAEIDRGCAHLGVAEAAWVAVGAFVDELLRSGVRHFCLAPGSRSTPLAIMLAERPEARLWMHLDERSCAFFGLGLARTRREPVALVCTSGSAAANFFPAVVEAFRARVPLVVLTADRPRELRDVGASQTIDQVRLYGTHAKWFVDLPEPPVDATADLIRHVRTVAARAATTARRGPAGPVHVNWPFREPLVPRPVEPRPAWAGRDERRPFVQVSAGRRVLPRDDLEMLAADLAGLRRGLIVCGPQDDPALPAAATRLAQALGYPVLADPLSGLRRGPHDRSLVLDAYDAFLRDALFVERCAPEVVIRFGDMPTSAAVPRYLQRHPWTRHIVVDGDAGWNEPTRLATEMLYADAALLCDGLLELLSASSNGTGAWADAWLRANRAARRGIAEQLGAFTDELFEGRVFAEIAELLPDGASLYAGNSMPVRDMDTFTPAGPRQIRFLSNRGANGIDGVISSAFGASAGEPGPVVLVIGDISFYHDSNGLLAARRHGLDLTIVLLNNDGGGIFSFLSQATEAPGHFEALFGTPHGLDFRPLAETYGAVYSRVDRWEQLREAVRRGMAEGGLHVVEVPTPARDRNVVLHRQVWAAVSRELAPELETVEELA